MPARSLPKSATARLKAFQTAKNLKDGVPAPLVIPYSAATIARLDAFYPSYKLKVDAMEAALAAQAGITQSVKEKRQQAVWLISHFYINVQNAIMRKAFDKSVRAFYGLDVNSGKVPALKSESKILYWGELAADGEAARIAAGGVPVTFPSIAEVSAAVNNFKNANLLQANAKYAFDIAQETLAAAKSEANKLILKMWNETEATFDTGDKPSLRRKCRAWGVVYIPNKGEASEEESV